MCLPPRPLLLQEKKSSSKREKGDKKEKKDKSDSKDKSERRWLPSCCFAATVGCASCLLRLHHQHCCAALPPALSDLLLISSVPAPLPTWPAGDKKEKKGASDKLADHKVAADGGKGSGKGGSGAKAAAAAAPPARPAPRRPPPPEPKGNPNDYLAGLDLPSSDSESDDGIERRRGMGEEDQPAVQINMAVSVLVGSAAVAGSECSR